MSSYINIEKLIANSIKKIEKLVDKNVDALGIESGIQKTIGFCEKHELEEDLKTVLSLKKKYLHKKYIREQLSKQSKLF